MFKHSGLSLWGCRGMRHSRHDNHLRPSRLNILTIPSVATVITSNYMPCLAMLPCWALTFERIGPGKSSKSIYIYYSYLLRCLNPKHQIETDNNSFVLPSCQPHFCSLLLCTSCTLQALHLDVVMWQRLMSVKWKYQISCFYSFDISIYTLTIKQPHSGFGIGTSIKAFQMLEWCSLSSSVRRLCAHHSVMSVAGRRRVKC